MKSSSVRGIARGNRGGYGGLSLGGGIRRGACAFSLCLAATLAAPGCSSSDGKAVAPVFPVKGKVTFEGESAAGAFVVFHPKASPAPGGESNPSAQVQPDGTFQLTTRSQADGAPAGNYAVTVQWNKTVKQGNDSVAGPNVIPPIYSKPDTSPIQVTVNASPNDLPPFEITRKK